MTVAVPEAPFEGLNDTVQFGYEPENVMAVRGSKLVLLDVLLRAVLHAGVDSTSEIMTGIPLSGVLTAVNKSGMFCMVGASFVALTVNVNDFETVLNPSFRVNCNVEELIALSTGVTVAVQLGQVPDQTTAPTSATTAGALEL